jgi:hypothetical protein
VIAQTAVSPRIRDGRLTIDAPVLSRHAPRRSATRRHYRLVAYIEVSRDVAAAQVAVATG